MLHENIYDKFDWYLRILEYCYFRRSTKGEIQNKICNDGLPSTITPNIMPYKNFLYYLPPTRPCRAAPLNMPVWHPLRKHNNSGCWSQLRLINVLSILNSLLSNQPYPHLADQVTIPEPYKLSTRQGTCKCRHDLPIRYFQTVLIHEIILKCQIGCLLCQ